MSRVVKLASFSFLIGSTSAFLSRSCYQRPLVCRPVNPSQSRLPSPVPASVEASQLSTPELKLKILRGVSEASRDSSVIPYVVSLICNLEGRNPTCSPTDASNADLLDGEWSLLATYPAASGAVGDKKSRGGPLGALQALSDVAYEALYKNARWSWLAGATRTEGSSSARSYQNIDLSKGEIYNSVEFGGPASWPAGRISVRGSLAPVSATTLEIVFVESSIKVKSPPLGLAVPLPRPRGFVELTYLDCDMRISRGSRNNLFLTVRPRVRGRRASLVS